ncbi:MAG: hypothetical protein QGH20_06645, partial [Candidatus Latescibacteria bacterium]|nr:hypothetical protein [Candidatus Latescibacterota bacterium]
HQNAITVRQLWPGEDNHSDDELIVLAFDPILRYETDPAIRRVILLGMEQTYNILKEKRGAWFNYIYQAATGRTADPHGSRLWLERLPMSQIRWGYDHRLREDVHVDPQWVEAGRPRLNRPLGPHETEWARWTSNPYQLGNGGGGTEEGDGVVFLLPYWMGRYHGWIE